MKKLLLTVAIMVGLMGLAKADVFNPISPENKKVQLTSLQASGIFDSGTILTDVTQVINYLGVKDGAAYNFKLKQWDNTVGATFITYAPWGLSADLEMLNADGVAGVVAWNVGQFL